MIININGEILDKDSAKISVLDRGFLFGDSVYDVTNTIEGLPFLLDDHLNRLVNSAFLMGMEMTYSIDEIKEQVKKTVQSSDIKEGNIRIILTRGVGEISLDPNVSQKNNLVIIYRERPVIPDEYYERGVPIIIAGVQRNSKKSVDPNIKSGNYLNNVLAMAEAKKFGAYEAVMLNQAGCVTEATTSNIWIVKNNTFITPPLQAGLLEGITRKHLLELAQKHGLAVQQSNLVPADLKNADECFLTSTSRMVLPVTQVDEFVISEGRIGPNTLKLLNKYREFVQEWKKSFHW